MSEYLSLFSSQMNQKIVGLGLGSDSVKLEGVELDINGGVSLHSATTHKGPYPLGIDLKVGLNPGPLVLNLQVNKIFSDSPITRAGVGLGLQGSIKEWLEGSFELIPGLENRDGDKNFSLGGRWLLAFQPKKNGPVMSGGLEVMGAGTMIDFGVVVGVKVPFKS